MGSLSGLPGVSSFLLSPGLLKFASMRCSLPTATSWLFLLCLFTAPAMGAPDKIGGVSLVSPPNKVDAGWTESVCRLNAGWVSVQPYAYSRQGQPQVIFGGERQWWGERLEGARELIRHAHANHLKVMHKPMVWIGGGWVGGYTLETEAEWKIWEASYTDYILLHARMAEEEKAELFCIGTEFNQVVMQRPAFWRNLIAEVRKVYHGQLTYAANWDNFQEVRFWDLLDYIGVDAYFPLSPDKVPSVRSLVRLWKEPAQKIELFHKAYRKPVLFTEFGYRSIDACAWKHWEVEQVPNHERVNLASQINAYKAFFEYYWAQDWFAGVFIWQWYTNHAQAGGPADSDFTPQNKPAEEVICKWFGW
jgi:hypothetical protein